MLGIRSSVISTVRLAVPSLTYRQAFMAPITRVTRVGMPSQNSAVSARGIVSVTALKDTYNHFVKDHQLSPLHGALFDFSGTLERLYDFAEHISSATGDLTRLVFFKRGHQLKSTDLKSNPAYSLTPKLLAKIMYHLNNGTLAKAREEISTQWREYHKKTVSNGKISKEKVNHVLGLIIASHAECSNKQFHTHTTERILLALLFYKSQNRQDISDYLEELNRLGKVLADKPFKIDSEFLEIDISQCDNQLASISRMPLLQDRIRSFIEQKYEDLTITLMINGKQLPKVLGGHYRYEGAAQPVESKPDCVEANLHNLCNILLFNNVKNKFDFSLLPKSLKPNEKLKSIYAMQDFRPTMINDQRIGQAFVNLFAGQEFQYRSVNWELKAAPGNFLPVMNFLFGVNASTCEELSKLFSDESRTVEFRNTYNTIDISIQAKGSTVQYARLTFDWFHSDIVADCWNTVFMPNSVANLNDIVEEASKEVEKDSMLLSLLQVASSSKVVESMEVAAALQNKTLQTKFLYPYFVPKNEFEATVLMICAISHVDQDPKIADYMIYFINKYIHYFPSLISKVSRMLVDRKLEYTGKLQEICIQHAYKYLSALTEEELADPNREKIVELIKQKHDINKLLIEAVKDNNLNLVKFLTKMGADPNCIEYSKFMPVIITLIKAGADLTKPANFRKPEFLILLLENDGEVVKRLIAENMLPINKVFIHVVDHCTSDIVELLLEAGANPDQADESGKTALHHAVINQDKKKVKLLLDAKAKVDVVDQQGRTPIDYAQFDDIKNMLKNNVDTVKDTPNVKSPTLFAPRVGTADTIEDPSNELETRIICDV